MLAIDLISLNSARTSTTFSCLSDLLLSPIPCSIILLMSLTWALSLLFSSFDDAKSSWSLLSIVSSLRAAVTTVCCFRISVSSFAAAVAIVACCCSSICASSFAAAAALVVCCRSSSCDSSCVAASCLSVNLFSSSSFL